MDILAWILYKMFAVAIRTLHLAGKAIVWACGTAWHLIRRSRGTFGSARFARLWELWWYSLFGGDGIIVGKRWGRFIRFNGQGYALVFGATRSGKGAGIIVPALLDYKGSVVCIDPKGENHAITARARMLRGPIFTLNVTDPVLSDAFNPLTLIRVNTSHEADDAAELANLLVTADHQSQHWDDKARDLLQCLMLYVVRRYAQTPELMTLARLRSLVALGWDGLEAVFDEARELGSPSLRDFAGGFLGMDKSEEARSILSNADKAVKLFAADRPAGMVTRASDFDIMDLNRQVMSLFIIVDEEKLVTYRPFIRILTGCALMAMTRAKAEAPPPVPTLLIFDEAAAVGRLENLETGVAYLAAYAKLLLVYQDLSQLRRTTPMADSIVANATCRIAMGVNDLETAKALAESIGPETVRSRSNGRSQRNVDMLAQQHNSGQSETQRMLLDPSEILRLPRHQSIIFFGAPVKLRFPIRARKVRYFREWRWRGTWDRWREPASREESPLAPPALPESTIGAQDPLENTLPPPPVNPLHMEQARD